MEQFGLITEASGDTATVSLQKHSACEKCGRCGILSGAGKQDVVIEASNPIQAQKGQRVLLESDDRRVLFVSFMLYMVPLGGLIAGIFLWLAFSDFLGFRDNQELYAVGTGFAIMAVIFLFIRSWDKRAKGNPYYRPIIVEVIENYEAGTDCDPPDQR